MILGKKNNLNKVILTILIVFLITNISYSQVNYEEKAISYFCNNTFKIIPELEKSKIVFLGLNTSYPKVYEIADCFGDINILKDSIPDKLFLDSLSFELSQRKTVNKKINISCKKINRKIFRLFRKNIFDMWVYNSVQYKKNNVVEIFEIRPKWDDEKVIENFPIARVKYVKSKNIWRIYWRDSNEKWVQYKPSFEVAHFSKAIEVIKKDEHGCFWG